MSLTPKPLVNNLPSKHSKENRGCSVWLILLRFPVRLLLQPESVSEWSCGSHGLNVGNTKTPTVQGFLAAQIVLHKYHDSVHPTPC